MKSLKATARRGALISVAAVSALALASCSAGQITQTSSQVAAVDGAEGNTSDNAVAVRDVTVHLTSEGEAGLKFTAINQDPSDKEHNLQSVTVGGEEVTIDGETAIPSGTSLVADIASEIEKLTEPDLSNITFVKTSLKNTGLALGGTKDVVFTFDDGEITVNATISEPVLESGTEDRTVSTEEASH